MGKILNILFVLMFVLSCENNREVAIQESMEIIKAEIKKQPVYLFKSLIHSPVSIGFRYMKKIFVDTNLAKAMRMRAIYYFSEINKLDFLLKILEDPKKPKDYRLFAFHLLAEKNDKRILQQNIEQYITQQIASDNIRYLADNKVEFYSHLPLTNMAIVNAVKKTYLKSTNYIECISAYEYLKKLNKIDNRDLLLKIPEVNDPLRSRLLTKIDTSKDVPLLRSAIRPALKEPIGEQYYLVLLMLADELSISQFSYLDLFNKPLLLNNLIDKQSIATTALLSGRAKGNDYETYLSYILQSSLKKGRDEISYFPPVFRIISLEKKESRITKVFQYLLEKCDEEVVYTLLRGRELKYSEIPLVEKYLNSDNKELRLLTALRIVRASELHETKKN